MEYKCEGSLKQNIINIIDQSYVRTLKLNQIAY